MQNRLFIREKDRSQWASYVQPYPNIDVENHQAQGFPLPSPEWMWALWNPTADEAHKGSFCPGYPSVHQAEAFLPPPCSPTTGLQKVNEFPPGLGSYSEPRWFASCHSGAARQYSELNMPGTASLETIVTVSTAYCNSHLPGWPPKIIETSLPCPFDIVIWLQLCLFSDLWSTLFQLAD